MSHFVQQRPVDGWLFPIFHQHQMQTYERRAGVIRAECPAGVMGHDRHHRHPIIEARVVQVTEQRPEIHVARRHHVVLHRRCVQFRQLGLHRRQLRADEIAQDGGDLFHQQRKRGIELRADLRRADLRAADLGGACLVEANLSGANLYGAV
jgi:hypothetical protein